MTAGATPRPAPRRLLAQPRDVLFYLPLFLTAPLYRGWHLRWGATTSELADAMPPGDVLVRDAQLIATRAITTDAPPEAVWPWLRSLLAAIFWLDHRHVYDALRVDAAGFLLKDASAPQLVSAMEGTVAGEAPMAPRCWPG